MIGSPVTEPLASGVAEHHRRTEELLERLDGFYESVVTPPATALIVACLTEFLREGDRRLLPLVARLERTNPEED
jgi:hypothetical protein